MRNAICLACCGLTLCSTSYLMADQRSASVYSPLWRGVSDCYHCDASGTTSAVVTVPQTGALSPAAGDVTIGVRVYADLRGSSGYVWIKVGDTWLTPSTPGVVSGVPTGGNFFQTDGSNRCYCCEGSNVASIVVTGAFFNAQLNADDKLVVTIAIAPGSTDVPCVAEACGCTSNIDTGYQTVTVIWTPGGCQTSADCDDGLYCTVDTCNMGTGECSHSSRNCSDGNSCTNDSCNEGLNRCDHTNNNNPCSDGLFCNGNDHCAGGSCSAHDGDPCAGQECCEATNTCAECCDDAFCDDGDPCTGSDSCVSGMCQSEFGDCNDNSIGDACDVMDWDVDADVDLRDAAAFQSCFGQDVPACRAAFDLALLCGPTDLDDYSLLSDQLAGPSGFAMAMMGGESAESLFTLPDQDASGGADEPDDWTVTDAAVAFEVRPLGGRNPVTVLAPNTRYEVWYQADYSDVQYYMLAVLSASTASGFTTAEPASDGDWAGTGDFMWIDLTGDPGGLLPAIGYPEGYVMLGLVGDTGAAGREGQLFRFTTGPAGELTFDLKMGRINEQQRSAVNMEGQARFSVE